MRSLQFSLADFEGPEPAPVPFGRRTDDRRRSVAHKRGPLTVSVLLITDNGTDYGDVIASYISR